MTRGLLRRIAIIGGAALGLALLPLGGAGGWAGYLHLTGNIHEVEPGVYRSRQLDGGQLTALLTDKSIRTVINLRGGTMDDAWYRDEVAAVASAGAWPRTAGRRRHAVALLRPARPDVEKRPHMPASRNGRTS